jgi:uncharacterized protein (TIGR01777 family)
MRIGITGATGFLGKPLVRALCARGDAVVVFSRDPARAKRSLPVGAEARSLDAITGETFSGLDAVVNLAGEPVADGRWDERRKRAIRESRVETTRAVVNAIERASPRPRALVNASGVGYYGPRGEEVVTEGERPGTDFLAEVCRAWEDEAERATPLGVRVVRARIGVVLGEGGGALEKLVLPFKLFVGGPIGSGEQYVPWVHLDDAVGMFLHALDHESVRGAMNVSAPEPLKFRDLAAVLGRVLHRPSWLRVPGFAVRAAAGELAYALLTGQRAVPRVAQDTGYHFTRPDPEEAVRSALGR